jgi:UDP-2-acetamido-2,6-beta-L-arabino-hexul-4-ose reductase
MRLAVTGAGGFLGWHVRCQAFARGIETVPVHRGALADPDRLADTLHRVDAVVHCAGVNRGTDSAVTDGNLAAAHGLADAVRRVAQPIRVVYANSVHARGDSGYGVAKRKAGALLAGASPAGFSDVLLPNLFGEHGRPHYNSFVATFCRELSDGRRPAEVHDREIALLHAQDAARMLVDEATATGHRSLEPGGTPVSVSGVLRTLVEFESAYSGGELPDLTDRFRLGLFHTYRSYLFPDRYPIALARHSDSRGALVECVRTGATGGQAFVSSTSPGAVRGEHVHLRKFERFVVVDGRAEIALRRLFTDQVVRFAVDGERPAIVDMPTMWAHSLTNVDDRPVTTFFWTNEVFRPEDADTVACPISGGWDVP